MRRRPGHLNIRRTDRPGKREHGWSVHIVRWGQRHTRYFADSVCGGRRSALQAAIRWRDEKLLSLGPILRLRRYPPPNKRVKTGIVGVTVEWKHVEGRRYRCYRASWPDGAGGSVRRSFYVKKYGAQRARELAARARAEGIAELERHARVTTNPRHKRRA